VVLQDTGLQPVLLGWICCCAAAVGLNWLNLAPNWGVKVGWFPGSCQGQVCMSGMLTHDKSVSVHYRAAAL
jgi:hypothetical protein